MEGGRMGGSVEREAESGERPVRASAGAQRFRQHFRQHFRQRFRRGSGREARGCRMPRRGQEEAAGGAEGARQPVA